MQVATESSCIPDSAEATTIVAKLPNGWEASRHELIHFLDYSSDQRRDETYKKFHILCLRDIRDSLGWLLCNYIFDSTCTVKSGLKHFAPRSDTSHRFRHIVGHGVEPKEEYVSVPSDALLSVFEAAAHACIMHNMPFS